VAAGLGEMDAARAGIAVRPPRRNFRLFRISCASVRHGLPSLGSFCSNYFWYFLLTWLPFYLVRERHFSMNLMATVVRLHTL